MHCNVIAFCAIRPTHRPFHIPGRLAVLARRHVIATAAGPERAQADGLIDPG
jgi:hypothetical protein